MAIMAIDHASFFISKVHAEEFWGISLPGYDHILTFITRFITHICAPGFFFLLGVSMALFARSRRKAGWTEKKIFRYFAFRGLLLIMLQMFIENPAWFIGLLQSPGLIINPPGGGGAVYFHFGVLYGLGAAMIIWAMLLRLGRYFYILFSIGAILVPQFLIPSSAASSHLFSPLLRLLLIPGQTGHMQVFYSILPWLGLTGLGLAFGELLEENRKQASRAALFCSIVSFFLFVVIRVLGGFGNIHPPSGHDLISFLNMTKYPASLSFILITMTVNLIMFVFFERFIERLGIFKKFLLTLGRAALFFYILHLYLFAFMGFFFPNGLKLELMYLFWLMGLLILYPLCRWYGNFKQTTSLESFWRFF